jgi:hypothetical protein
MAPVASAARVILAPYSIGSAATDCVNDPDTGDTGEDGRRGRRGCERTECSRAGSPKQSPESGTWNSRTGHPPPVSVTTRRRGRTQR